MIPLFTAAWPPRATRCCRGGVGQLGKAVQPPRSHLHSRPPLAGALQGTGLVCWWQGGGSQLLQSQLLAPGVSVERGADTLFMGELPPTSLQQEESREH